MHRVPTRPVRHRIDPDVLGSGRPARILLLLRELHVELVRIQRAYVDAVGLDPADLRAGDLISQHWERPLSMGQLADLLGLSSGAVTGTVDRLERAGLVERIRDPADRRRVHLRLTRRAEEVGAEFYGEHVEAIRTAVARFGDEELDAAERVLAAILPRLADDLDEDTMRQALEDVAPAGS